MRGAQQRCRTRASGVLLARFNEMKGRSFNCAHVETAFDPLPVYGGRMS
jgi:hypothetical protein